MAGTTKITLLSCVCGASTFLSWHRRKYKYQEKEKNRTRNSKELTGLKLFLNVPTYLAESVF